MTPFQPKRYLKTLGYASCFYQNFFFPLKRRHSCFYHKIDMHSSNFPSLKQMQLGFLNIQSNDDFEITEI